MNPFQILFGLWWIPTYTFQEPRLAGEASNKRTLRRYSGSELLQETNHDAVPLWSLKDSLPSLDRTSFVPAKEFVSSERRRLNFQHPVKPVSDTEEDTTPPQSTLRTVRQTMLNSTPGKREMDQDMSNEIDANIVRELDEINADGTLTNLPLTINKATICTEGSVATFIRVPRSMIMGIPTIVSTIEVVTCSQYCRNNTEPTSGARRLCQGFNYQDSNAPTCEFFDGQAQLGPLNRNVGPRSFYYDKICLTALARPKPINCKLNERGRFTCFIDASKYFIGADACAQRPYAFEASPNSQLLGNVVKSIVVDDESSCLSACLREQGFSCQSVNYVRDRRVCEMSRFSRRNKLQDFSSSAPGVDYYENNCLTKRSRCTSGEMYFVKTFDSEITGFDITEGIETLNSCLDKCLDSEFIFCRSVEYDRSTNECLVSDEDSFSIPEMVNSAQAVGIDLYEPVCLPGGSDAEINCKRPYLFEKIVKSALESSQPSFRVLNGMTPEDCMNRCAREIRCRSINYNRNTETCMMSELDRKNATATLGPSQNIDYYENNCRKVNTVQGCFFTLEGVGRVLRPEFRNRELQAGSSVDCKMSCIRNEEACKSVSFNDNTQTCYHSQLNQKSAPFELLAMVDLDFDTYIKGDCIFNEQGPRERNLTQLLEAQRQEPQEVACDFQLGGNGRELKPFFRNDLVKVDSFSDCQLMCQSIQSYDCVSLSYSERRNLCGLSQLGLGDYPLDTLTQVDPDFKFYLKGECSGSTRARARTDNSINSIETTFPPMSRSRHATPTQRRAQTGPFTVSGGLQRLSPSTVEVNALCSSDGVNVSVVTTNLGGYTGAIYAAERFSFCRNLVTAQSGFWLFLPRPSINSACNTIMVNDVLSGVVVISNDNVIPYDVTTKDDMFYQVSCDFSGAALNDGGRVIVTGGLVVGGPTPRVVAGAGVPSTFDATLRILRGGLPVQNVLIGEQLSLNIDSSIDSVRMMLMQCNVSRIGGSGPLPDPLTIVDNGCPIVSQVIGPIERTPQGLQAPLTAFRIDGSAEIQIVCMVMFCPQQCTPVVCPRTDGASFQSLGRRKREVDLTLGDPDDQNVVESVNGRLRVYVEGEDGAPSEEAFRARDPISRQANCVPEATFVAVTAVLGLLVALLMTSLACMLCRRSWMVALQHKLLTEHIGRAMSRHVPDSPGSHQISSPCSSSGSSQVRSIHHTQRGRPALLRTSEM